nr:reverse transcriptase domain-containing protein [Tanacetum cinerariifolium]
MRTMVELLRAPTEGYTEAIVVPLILVEQFELKHSLINMMTSDQFFGFEKENPYDHIRCDVTTAITAILKQFQATPPLASVNSVEEICVTCGGARPYHQCLAADGKTFPELQDNIQGYVSVAAVNYNQEEDERVEENLTDPKLAVILKKLLEKLGGPGKFFILCGFSELKCKALADLGANINLMPLSVWKKLGLHELISTRMTLKLANRAICTPARIARDVFVLVFKFTFPANFVIVDYESDPRVSLVMGRPFLRTARALIDVHVEEMILCNSAERLTLNMRHDTKSYSNQPQKESINMINIYDDSCEDFLEDLFATNHLSGNPTFSSHFDLTSPKVKDDIFDLEGEIVLDSTKDLLPTHNINPLSSSTTSSSPDHLLEEFADALALITFPLRNDDLPFDIEFDLKEIKYFLNHDLIKEMDSILEDSINECNLANPNVNLFDTIPKMFTDEHALDYSSPPLYDKYDDDLVEFESDVVDVYNDPFDSKGEKIKESKILIDKLVLPRSSDFLPSPEYDSFLFEDFSEVDALPLTNNEEKIFNHVILIHENLSEVTTSVAPDKNVKKIAISHAFLFLEDFDSLSMNFLSKKKFPGPKLYSCFHPKMRNKFSNPGFSLLKEFILIFSRNYLIGALKFSMSLKFLKAQWRFFLALMERTSISWMFRVFISIPHDRINLGVGSS